METSKVFPKSVQFSRQGMAAVPLPVPVPTSSFARRLLEARGDPDKARVVVWLLNADDELAVCNFDGKKRVDSR